MYYCCLMAMTLSVDYDFHLGGDAMLQGDDCAEMLADYPFLDG